jgi:acyl-CoA synthetase (AMP-forming)/AMP-acid ligase II
MSVGTLLQARAAERGDAPAVTLVGDGEPRVLTYAQLDADARRIAGALAARYAPGDRVLLPHPLGPEFVTAFAGALYAGLVAVPAPAPGRYRHQHRRTRAIAADAGVRAVLTEPSVHADVEAWAADQGLAVDLLDTTAVAGSYDDAVEDRSALALLQYTSGSTGEPKGVMISHANLLHNVGVLTRAMGFTRRTRFGGWIPLYHDMGLIGQLLPALFLGAECVLMAPAAFARRPVRWLQLIDEHDVHWSAAPNFAYELVARSVTDEQVAALDLSRWRYAANGSEPIRPATLAAFARRLAPAGFRAEALCPCYGLAESTVFVSGSPAPPTTLRVDPAALESHRLEEAAGGTELAGCGPVPDGSVVVVDPGTGERLGAGRIGELWVRSGSVAGGYWENPAATAATFGATTADGEAGWLRTGDLGALHGGEVYVTGRIKDVLVVRGRNLYPQDIEHEVRVDRPELAGGVGAVFTVPAPDEEIIVTHEIRGRADAERLRAVAAGVRAMVTREFGARAAGVVLLKPGGVRRTTSGKVQRSAMRRLFLAGELPAVHSDLDPSVRALVGSGVGSGGGDD